MSWIIVGIVVFIIVVLWVFIGELPKDNGYMETIYPDWNEIPGSDKISEPKKKMMLVELTDRQEQFLKQFAEDQFPGSDKNVCTHKPIHAVQSEDRVYFEGDSEYGDEVCFFRDEYETEYDVAEELVEQYYEDRDEEPPIPIIPFDEAHRNNLVDEDGETIYIYDYDDYFKAYGIDDVRIASYVIRWRDIAFFFILDEAKRYIEYQRHNLIKPRTFTYSPGYSNCGDYEPFWDLLMTMGTILNERDGKTCKVDICVRYNREANHYYYVLKQMDGPFKYDSSVDEYFFATSKECEEAAINKRLEVYKLLANTGNTK